MECGTIRPLGTYMLSGQCCAVPTRGARSRRGGSLCDVVRLVRCMHAAECSQSNGAYIICDVVYPWGTHGRDGPHTSSRALVYRCTRSMTMLLGDFGFACVRSCALAVCVRGLGVMKSTCTIHKQSISSPATIHAATRTASFTSTVCAYNLCSDLTC